MNWFRRIMAGRYGVDALGLALLIVSLILNLLTSLTRWRILAYLSFIPLILCFYRMFSRNIYKRNGENMKFMGFWRPIQEKFKRRAARSKDKKTHRYFSCPTCKQTLRVPKGRGKIEITCPKCKTKFTKKT